MNIYEIYLLFWTFAVLGWLMEVIFCSLSDKRLVNRGFFIGPYCPIYGFGAILMLLLSPYKDNPIICFILALFICSILEYFTSFLMEKLFNVRWWDYSIDAFNINGRVCLRNALAFGALGVLFTKYLNPLFFDLIHKVDIKIIKIICLGVLIVTLVDILISFKAMSSIKKIINKNIFKYQKKDATEDVKMLIREKIINVNFLERRLIKTYHLFEREIKSHIDKINKKTGSGYGVLLVFAFLGLLIGLIISLVFKLDSYKKILPFTVSLSTLIAVFILKVGRKE